MQDTQPSTLGQSYKDDETHSEGEDSDGEDHV
jgi:hypothetical protein